MVRNGGLGKSIVGMRFKRLYLHYVFVGGTLVVV
jgi:hypothetical protein